MFNLDGSHPGKLMHKNQSLDAEISHRSLLYDEQGMHQLSVAEAESDTPCLNKERFVSAHGFRGFGPRQGCTGGRMW